MTNHVTWVHVPEDPVLSQWRPRSRTMHASASWPPPNAASIATESGRPRWTTLRPKLDCPGPASTAHFADRDDLLLELITRHGRALLDRAHKTLSRQGSLADQIIESLLYIADHGRRDPLTRYLIDPDCTSLGRQMIASGASEMLRAELWDSYLDAAVAANELPPGVTRSDIYLWMGNVGKILMRGLDEGDGDLKRYRSILRRFVAPAFTSANA